MKYFPYSDVFIFWDLLKYFLTKTFFYDNFKFLINLYQLMVNYLYLITKYKELIYRMLLTVLFNQMFQKFKINFNLFKDLFYKFRYYQQFSL